MTFQLQKNKFTFQTLITLLRVVQLNLKQMIKQVSIFEVSWRFKDFLNSKASFLSCSRCKARFTLGFLGRQGSAESPTDK